MLVFAIHGVVVGSLFSRMAGLQSAAGIGDVELGLALTGLPAGVLTGSLLVSRLIERHGAGWPRRSAPTEGVEPRRYRSILRRLFPFRADSGAPA
jgi:hypothetical protein